MLNQVFKVFSGTRQQFVEDAIKISNIFGFSTITSVATLQMKRQSLCVYIENFLTNQLVQKF